MLQRRGPGGLRNVIKAGAVLSLTGRFAPQGGQARRGLVLWAEGVNSRGGLTVRERGRPAALQLLIYDDQSRTGVATARTERLIVDERVDLLFGPYSSVLTLAVVAVAERHGKVLWNHGGSSDAVSQRGLRFVVNLPSPASRYFVGVLEMARAAWGPARSIALLYGASGTFPAAVTAGTEAYAARREFEVVFKAPYLASRDDMAALVAEVAAREPDVILGVGTTEADLRFARQLRRQRVRTLLTPLIGLVAAPIQLFMHTLGTDADGFFGPSQWEPGLRDRPDVGPWSVQFCARFRDLFGTEPDYPAAQAHAAGLIAEQCVEIAGTLRDEALREAASTLDLSTFYGRFRLDDATGQQVGHELVVVQWQAGKKLAVWPPPVAEAPPQFGVLP